MADPVFDLELRRELLRAQVAERRRSQASGKRIAASIEYEETLRDLHGRRRTAEHAAATSRGRRQKAALALVEALDRETERFVKVEGPALLEAAEAVARAIESAVVAPKKLVVEEPAPDSPPATAPHGKSNGRSSRPYG